MHRLKRIAPFLKPLLILALFVISLRVLHDTLAHYRYRDVMGYVSALPGRQLFLASALTLLGYLMMTGYDTLAFRYIRHPLPYFKIALASFIGYAINNTVGFSGVVGVGLRYRLYNAWRLTAVEITKVIAFCTVTFWLGFVLLGGVFFLASPPDVPPSIHLPFGSIRLLGFVLLLPAVAYMLWIGIRREPIRIKQWEFELPSLGLFSAQVATSCLDWIMAAGVMYILLPSPLAVTFLHFVGIFLLAQVAGVASNVPGGLGIFEAIILVFLAPFSSAPAILGALVAFRVVYYLLPLLVAILLLATHEIVEKREGVVKAWRIFGRWAPGIAPQLLAFTTFVGGAVLLFSGSTPALPGRLGILRRLVPLPVVEISHFFGSITGAALLLLARGLQRRLDAAYHITVVVLGAGILFQLFKGGDFEEAIILAVMLFALIASRSHFYRKASLFNEGFGPGWILAILLVLISSSWLGFFSYKHVEYSGDLWWHFSFRADADAPRFLRASVGVVGVLLLFSIQRLLRPAAHEPDPPTVEEVDRAGTILMHEKNSQANIALLGDKPLLFSPSGNTFLMYGVEGRSWIAMGDPIGVDDEKQELIWQFRAMCDVHAGWPVFYEVQRQNLHFYLDLGLTLLKIGEEARVSLKGFSLDGGKKKWMRYVLRRVEAEGCSFEIIESDQVIDELRVISDSWLAEKQTREKGFSLGFFSEQYLRRCAVAVVRRDNQIVAFANLWNGAGDELSVDLMRHLPDAPAGVMDYMFLSLFLWGQEQGYRWFNLGMAPLSGLENRTLGTLWSRVGALTYRFGENFYNFQGLRQYKEKFDPEWEPMYLASPGGLALPRILTNLAALISGGLRGVISK
jgi:Uncharacterized conserved protein